jgi:hypothetical protein
VTQIIQEVIDRLERIVVARRDDAELQTLDRDDRNAIRCAIALLKETTS